MGCKQKRESVLKRRDVPFSPPFFFAALWKAGMMAGIGAAVLVLEVALQADLVGSQDRKYLFITLQGVIAALVHLPLDFRVRQK